jgi:hypothetical protein
MWSGEDEAFVATHPDFPLLSWIDANREAARDGLLVLMDSVRADLRREAREG